MKTSLTQPAFTFGRKYSDTTIYKKKAPQKKQQLKTLKTRLAKANGKNKVKSCTTTYLKQ